MAKHLSNFDLNQNELLNARLQNLATAPVSPRPGFVYFNTTTGRVMGYNGSAWIDMMKILTFVGTAPLTVSEANDRVTITVPAATTSANGLLTAAEKVMLNNLTTNLADKAPLASPLLTGLPKIRTGVTKAAGTAATEAFRIESSDLQPLFQVKTNGDTVMAGVLTVNGKGASTFAGDVNIGGNLHVDGTITGGTQVDLGENLTVTGNLDVKGNTVLGDSSAQDTLLINAVTKLVTKSTKALGSATAAAFKIESSDALPLFEVFENGDTKIAGVLTVKAVNTTGGDPATGGGTKFEGETTIDKLTVNNDLIVKGNTFLGDNAAEDSTVIRGVTSVFSKTTKALGSGAVGAFAVKDKDGVPLLQVMENGDTLIAGVLRVLGTGESEFAGNVKIGGNLTVLGNATVKGVMSGNDFNIQGNLNVDGNTVLGDNAGVDTTLINGFTRVKTAGTRTAAGAATTAVFRIEDASATPNSLFEVRQNGDTIIAGALTVTGSVNGGGTATKDLVVDGDLTVKGNTILGDSASDTIMVTGAATFSQAIKMNNNRITGMADPQNGADAATKNYVDATAQGVDPKESVKAASTGNLTLSGVQTIDGVSVVAGNRVLVKNQTNAAQNGIYIVGTGAWVRTEDANTSDKVTSGMYAFVEEGVVNADTGWMLVTNGAITLGTTLLSFTQFSGAGTYTAGNGLNLGGSVFSVVGTANRITVSNAGVDIAPTYVGQTSITTLGAIATGTWNATTIALAKGGTGATSAVAARSNLGATGKFTANIGNGTATEYVVAHNLNSTDIVVSIMENATKQLVYTDVEIVDANSIKVILASVPVSNALKVVVIG